MSLRVALTGLSAPAPSLPGAEVVVVDAGGGRPDVPPDADAVVVGPAAGPQVATAQAVHAAAPEAAVVLLLPAGDPGGVRRAVRYSPGVPADIDLLEEADPQVAERVVAAAARAAQRRRHRTLLAALAARPRAAAAGPAPAAAPLGTLLDHAPLGVLVVDPGGRLVSWNERAAGLLGVRAPATGTALTGYLLDPRPLDDVLRRVAQGAVVPALPVRPVGPQEVALELSAVPTRLDDGGAAVLVLLLDVTVRRAAEAARDELSARLHVVRRSQEFLLRASDVLAAASGYEETLEQLARVAVPTLGDLCTIDVLDEDRRLRRVAAAAADPAHQPLAEELRERYAPRRGSDHPAEAALDGRTRWAPEVTREWMGQRVRDARHLQLLEQMGVSGYIAVPLVAGEQVLGTVTLMSAGRGRRFGEGDVALAEELAGRVALVVAKARRYDREHRIAEALQRSLLPELPQLPGLQLAARYVPAREGTRVGGDWYDAFAFAGADPVLVIGDVVGHDLEAATRMGQMRNALRGLAHGRSGEPGAVLASLDALTGDLAVTDLASVLYAVLGPGPGGGRRLRWSNAGHLPPLLLTGDGRARFLEHEADPLVGVGAGLPRHEHVADLPPGSTLLLHTDGLVEHRGDQLQSGPEALRVRAAQLARRPLPELCDALVAELAQEADDDVAVLAVRVLPAG